LRSLQEIIATLGSAGVNAHVHLWSTLEANPANSHMENDCLYAAVAYLVGYPIGDGSRPMSAIARQLRHTAATFVEHNTSALSGNPNLFPADVNGRRNVAEMSKSLVAAMVRGEAASLREVAALEALFDCGFDVMVFDAAGSFAYNRAADSKRWAGVLLLFEGHWSAVVSKPAVMPSRPVMEPIT
jgi:hypothetical protein